ncbi:putative membrane protein [Massilia sp. PDC64]|nr:lysylphosphatidylglycerol synthase domain-containing protein [Massilia sp. PDC64]SDD70755.1 putative membrane protein [Massilia sp. PDC64]
MSRTHTMGRLAWAASIAGLALVAALVATEGWSGIVAAFERAGWALLLVVPARVVTQAFDTRAWRVLLAPFDPGHAAGPLFLLWVAFVREGVNRLLPVANIGGEVAGVRLASLRAPDAAGVAASVVVEVLLTIVVLYLFCGAGALLMLKLAAGPGLVGIVAAALLLSLPLPVLGWWLLRHGSPFARLERWMLRLLGPQNVTALHLDGAAIDAAIVRLFRQRGRLARAGTWSLLAYVLGTFETWYALKLLGHPVGVQAAFAIEALTQAVRHAGFMVPAGLGVQEAAVLLFGQLAGVGGDVALSLALVKRMREVATGVPALLSWHWFEVRRLRHGL